MDYLSQAKELLKTRFLFNQFRPGQAEAIQSILKGRDTFLVMPTGGGKSLCYQLPSLILPHLTLVISPLISLMKDQVDKLQKMGIQAGFINSSLTDFELRQRVDAMRRHKFNLVYIAPERLYSKDFTQILFNLDVSLIAVDEAHCVSTWGHDFRPSYLKIKGIAKKFKTRPIISAFTATATPFVRKDVVTELEMKNPHILVTGFDRPNLSYQAFAVQNNWQKLKNLVDYIKRQSKEQKTTGIIYASTRKAVESISNYLSKWDIPNLPYHAGMDDEVRKIHQEKFMQEQVPLVVATNAFGMGIDKKNLRFVVHFNMPGSLEAYYQEAGRAGRDGELADCLLYYHTADRSLQEFFIESSHPSKEVIQNVYEFLDQQNQKKILLTYEAINRKLPYSPGALAVGSSIKTLESYGLISRMTSQEHSAFVKLLIPPNKLNDLVSSRASVQQSVIQGLLSLFPNQLTQGIETELSYLAKTTHLSGEQITRALRTLENRGIISYTPPFRGYGIEMLKPKIPKEKLGIDYQKIKENLEHEVKKLDIMEGYVFCESCRRKFILEYFGDSKKIETCDNCDVCNG